MAAEDAMPPTARPARRGRDQPEILTEKNVQGPPALAIEVLSENTRKRGEQAKRRLFERTGVREYWVVDPDLDLVKSRVLPDLSLRLDSFFIR